MKAMKSNRKDRTRYVRNRKIDIYQKIDSPLRRFRTSQHELPLLNFRCVKWEQSVKRIYDPNRFDIAHLPHTIEVGPGTGGLNAMLTKLNGKAARRSSNFLT